MNKINHRKCIICNEEFKYNSVGSRHNGNSIGKRAKNSVTCSPTCSRIYTRIYSRIQVNLNKRLTTKE